MDERRNDPTERLEPGSTQPVAPRPVPGASGVFLRTFLVTIVLVLGAALAVAAAGRYMSPPGTLSSPIPSPFASAAGSPAPAAPTHLVTPGSTTAPPTGSPLASPSPSATTSPEPSATPATSTPALTPTPPPATSPPPATTPPAPTVPLPTTPAPTRTP